MSNRIPTTSPDYSAAGSGVLSGLDSIYGIELEAASVAIGIKEGLAVITKSSAAALLTLALPTAGLPSVGGDDGKILRIVSKTAFAHTVTTPTSGINGSVHIATFTAAAGNYLELVAHNASWWALASLNVTLS